MNQYLTIIVILYIINRRIFEWGLKPKFATKKAQLIHTSIGLFIIPFVILAIYNVRNTSYDPSNYFPYFILGSILFHLLVTWFISIYKYFALPKEQ